MLIRYFSYINCTNEEKCGTIHSEDFDSWTCMIEPATKIRKAEKYAKERYDEWCKACIC